MLQRFDIADLVQETMSLMTVAVPFSGIDARLDLAPETPHVLADRREIQRVIVNLVLNAFEAMQVARLEQRRLHIVSGSSGAYVFVRISDAGPGVALDDRERIFDALFGAKSGGIGMGLRIARTIARAHGGDLKIEGAEPGASFVLRLPVASPP